MGKPREPEEKREEGLQVRDLVRTAHINSERVKNVSAHLGVACMALHSCLSLAEYYTSREETLGQNPGSDSTFLCHLQFPTSPPSGSYLPDL